MILRFNCTKCGHKLKADQRDAGRRVKCSRCQEVQLVPEAPQFITDAPQATKPAHVASMAQVTDEEPLNVGKTPDLPEDLMDMTPMIDVVFQLLIFFMLTAAFGLQKSIEMPQSQPTDEASSRSVADLEQDNDYVVVRIEQDNTVWVDDAQAPSEQDLLSKLRIARQSVPGTGAHGPNKLLVLAHGDALHEKVVLALDAGAAVGMEEVRLATVEDNF